MSARKRRLEAARRASRAAQGIPPRFRAPGRPYAPADSVLEQGTSKRRKWGRPVPALDSLDQWEDPDDGTV